MPCSKCRKRSIIVFNCKCGKDFCSRCKYPEDHNCTFDYKAAQRDKLRINNPKVINNKIDKI